MRGLSAGEIIADKYRVDAVIGSGGMGVVLAATHVELGQRVAIKLLRDGTPETLARFQREARLLVRLRSAHVTRIFDVGSLHDEGEDEETPYIVMERLDGEDLGAILQTRQRLGVEEAVDHVLQACAALAEAHGLGMVHRDLKPSNLFLARGPGGTTSIKVLDFGVSKILTDPVDDETAAGGLTNEGVALGSPGYMSPEQMTSSRDVDARSDIFSLGAILYRLVGGQLPYKGSTVVSLIASMAIDPLVPLWEVVSDIPQAFSMVVERCLAQDRNARYQSVAELAQALAPFASRRGRAGVEDIVATVRSSARIAQAPSSEATTAIYDGAPTTVYERPTAAVATAVYVSPPATAPTAVLPLPLPAMRPQPSPSTGATVVMNVTTPTPRRDRATRIAAIVVSVVALVLIGLLARRFIQGSASTSGAAAAPSAESSAATLPPPAVTPPRAPASERPQGRPTTKGRSSAPSTSSRP